MTGKLIVIEGTDGSGKHTQVELLVERLRASRLPVRTMSFPRYGQKSAGPVEDYLAGNYGTPEQVGARRASVFYAVDRFAASREIRDWLDAGQNVILDRYVASNMGHQGSKISDATERADYFRWNHQLEFGLFGIPRPDLNVILHVPAEVTFRLMEQRGRAKDAHESDMSHLRAAERTYLEIARNFDGFTLIECVERGELLPREKIHELVWKEVAQLVCVAHGA